MGTGGTVARSPEAYLMTDTHTTTQCWRIGELSRRAAVNPKTIRYYEEAGLLPSPDRAKNGYRTYSEKDAAQLAFIRAAKDFGFTLGEIREVLAVRDRNEAPCSYILGVVEEKLADLNDRIQRLQVLSADLEAILRDVEAMPAELRAQKGEYCHVIENWLLTERDD
jgi:DNA-binding transcriptional MerR regulator